MTNLQLLTASVMYVMMRLNKNEEVKNLVEALVSIIIPVYNAQKYLSDCLDSVLSQSYRQFEVILINDGSRDESLNLCQQYVQRDGRVSCIHQENAGPGAARNTGLTQATGDYLLFIDSDDLLLPDALEAMVIAIQGQDLVIARFSLNTSSGKSVRGLINQSMLLDKLTFLKKFSIWPGAYYYSALWNKLYQRSIVNTNHISFRTDFIWGEDCLFNMTYYLYVKKINVIQDVVYQYNRKVSGLSWGSVLQLHKGIKIKREIYLALKKIFVEEDQYKKYFWHVQRYILNITLKD